MLSAPELSDWKAELADEARALLRDNQYKRLIPYLQFYHSTSDVVFQRSIKVILPYGRPIYLITGILRYAHLNPVVHGVATWGWVRVLTWPRVMYYEKGTIVVNEIRQRSVTLEDLWGYAV